MSKITIITLSFLLSLILSLLPLPEKLLEMSPQWSLLTLLFWTYHAPRRVNIGVAWCMGIVIDGVSGSLLGSHALSFVIVIYIFDLFYRRFHMFYVFQQSLVIGILIACNFLILFGLRHLLTENAIVWSLLLGAVSSSVCWPIYLFFGRRLHLIRS